jgi:hypothetical protein
VGKWCAARNGSERAAGVEGTLNVVCKFFIRGHVRWCRSHVARWANYTKST